MPIRQRLAVFPRAVFVAKIYALAQRWVRLAPEFVKQARTRDAQILFLQLNECRSRCVIVPREFKTKAIRFMLLRTCER